MKYSILILIFLFSSCSDKVAGGGSSGSEAGNAITATIFQTDGTPASGARVRLRSADYIIGDTSNFQVDIETRKNGELHLENVPSGSWNMEVDLNGHALLRRILIEKTDSQVILGKDTLRRIATINGSIPMPFPAGTRVVIPGTTHFTFPDDFGKFTLDSLPSGFHEIREFSPDGLADRSGYAKAAPGASVQVGPLASESDALLLEDFEDGDSRHRFADFSGSGWWFLSLDSNSVSIEPNPQGTPIPIPLEWDMDHGMVLHFKAIFDSAGLNPWLDCGVQIGQDSSSYNLSSVDSLVFWAKGVGEVLVMFHFASNPEGYSQEPQYRVQLPPLWTRISIPMDSLVIPNITGLDPKQIRSNLRAISWVFIQDSEFWLDEVSMVGATRSEIWLP